MVKKAKDIEVIEESSSEEEITMPKHSKQPREDIPPPPANIKVIKEKKPYVLTPARKAQFEKARLIREDNIARKNAIRDE